MHRISAATSGAAIYGTLAVACCQAGTGREPAQRVIIGSKTDDQNGWAWVSVLASLTSRRTAASSCGSSSTSQASVETVLRDEARDKDDGKEALSLVLAGTGLGHEYYNYRPLPASRKLTHKPACCPAWSLVQYARPAFTGCGQNGHPLDSHLRPCCSSARLTQSGHFTPKRTRHSASFFGRPSLEDGSAGVDELVALVRRV